MAEQRYIVLAESMSLIDEWRRDHQLGWRHVIAVTPDNADHALRGLSGDFVVMTHESWRPPPIVAARVQLQIATISLTAGSENTNG
jgi:hypothetical protein